MKLKEKKSKKNFDLKEIKKLNGIAKARAFLIQEPKLQGVFGFNSLISQPVFLDNLPWRKCENQGNGTVLVEKDIMLLMDYVLETYDNQIMLNEKNLRTAIKMMSYKNQFCPVQKYLLSLPEWDKKPRLSALFSEYLGADDNSYTRETSQLFLIAAVKRIFEPACKYDHMIVLQGKQELGKSSLLNILGGEWFSDSLRNFSDKTAIEQILGSWIIEVPELQGFKKADIDELKAFITRQIDKARLAFRHEVEPFERKCVLVGTTNNTEYLTDPTGNRRFLPIICTKKLDFDKLRANRNQLFAEALYHYFGYKNLAPNDFFKNPFIETLTLQSPEAKELANQARRQAEYIDMWEEIIENWLIETRFFAPDYWERKPYPNSNGKPYTADEKVERKRVATREIVKECLEPAGEKIGNNADKRISAIMQKWNCAKGHYRFGKRYGQVNGYTLPDDFYSKFDLDND